MTRSLSILLSILTGGNLKREAEEIIQRPEILPWGYRIGGVEVSRDQYVAHLNASLDNRRRNRERLSPSAKRGWQTRRAG